MALVKRKACGQEIGKGVKKCIHCGTDQRNFFGKHKIITAILVIIVLGAIGSAMGDKDKSKVTTTPVASSASPSASTPAPAPKPAELSEEGVSSDVKVAVTGFDSKSSIGDNQYSTAKAQGIFKVVSLSITNNQKDAITIDSNSFKLIDDQGREFSDSTEAQTAMMTSMSGKDDSFFLKKINPGITVTGAVAFDVPKDAKGFTLKATGGITGKTITLKVE